MKVKNVEIKAPHSWRGSEHGAATPLSPKYLLLDTGRNNFNLIANFRFLAIFQTLIQFRSYLCIRCTLFAVGSPSNRPSRCWCVASSPVGYLTRKRQWPASWSIRAQGPQLSYFAHIACTGRIRHRGLGLLKCSLAPASSTHYLWQYSIIHVPTIPGNKWFSTRNKLKITVRLHTISLLTW